MVSGHFAALGTVDGPTRKSRCEAGARHHGRRLRPTCPAEKQTQIICLTVSTAWPICDTVAPCDSHRRQPVRPIVKAAGASLVWQSEMRQQNRNSQNEPGMCPGINSFTFWCGPQTRSPRLAHIAKSAMYAPPEGWFWLRERTQPLGTKPECVLESIVSQGARLSRIGCVGEYLYGAPVLVPAALRWVGPELRRCG